ncbi:DEAD/DEAH box helicase [Sphingomonas sp. NFR04]|uniref:DEAD/DEAH box helicase n=1 Tax=Sphingomonas sp. NFR04 TaxID=1566283 RepID=UPI001C3128D2|nr:DEAD/DEAH box helicase [Sphingomonas sp. NFR04]
MKKIARILANPVVAKVELNDDPTKLALSNAMSFVVEGHEHMGNGGWDGRSTLFDWSTSKFPAGFVTTAIATLQEAGYEVQIVRKPLPAPLGPMPTQGFPIVDSYAPDPNRDYQFKAVRILEKQGSYIAQVATGGGKSRIAAMCITRIGRKTMFITTRSALLYQMGEALDEAGKHILAQLSDDELLAAMSVEMATRLKTFTVSYVGDSQWDTSGDVVCAMVQTLGQRVAPHEVKIGTSQVEQKLAAERWKQRYDEAIAFLDSIEFVIGEEAHEAGGGAYYEVLGLCRNAHYRLALTATPMMRDGESDMRLIARFGPIRLRVTEAFLINCGILAKPFFKFIPIGAKEQPPTLRRATAWQKAEELGIVNNPTRNKHVCAETIRGSRWGLPVGILVKRQKHGKILHEMLKQVGMKGEFIFGESGNAKRKAALDKLASGEYDYVIGSTIIDVGVDVPALQILIMAGGGKAEVAVRQRIGRALRKKRKTPNFAFIVEFDDGNNKHLIKHAKARRAIVEQTDGFKEGVLAKGKDFDFRGLGFTRPLPQAMAA